MDLAEAMLRPVDDVDPEHERTDRASDILDPIALSRSGRRRASTPAPQLRTRLATAGATDATDAIDDWFAELSFAHEPSTGAGGSDVARLAKHPHRRDARLERRRRPGAISRPAQPCTSPLQAKPASAPRTAS